MTLHLKLRASGFPTMEVKMLDLSTLCFRVSQGVSVCGGGPFVMHPLLLGEGVRPDCLHPLWTEEVGTAQRWCGWLFCMPWPSWSETTFLAN